MTSFYQTVIIYRQMDRLQRPKEVPLVLNMLPPPFSPGLLKRKIVPGKEQLSEKYVLKELSHNNN